MKAKDKLRIYAMVRRAVVEAEDGLLVYEEMVDGFEHDKVSEAALDFARDCVCDRLANVLGADPRYDDEICEHISHGEKESAREVLRMLWDWWNEKMLPYR